MPGDPSRRQRARVVEWGRAGTHVIHLPDRVSKLFGSRAVVPYVVWSAATGAAIDLSNQTRIKRDPDPPLLETKRNGQMKCHPLGRKSRSRPFPCCLATGPVTFNHGVEGSSPSALTMFLQQNLHFPKFSSGVFVRAVGKICAPVGKLLFRSCSVTVAARCSLPPAAGGYLVDLPSRYETRLPPWGDGKLAVGSPRRLGGDRRSVPVPGQNPAARYGSLEPIDAVDPRCKSTSGLRIECSFWQWRWPDVSCRCLAAPSRSFR